MRNRGTWLAPMLALRERLTRTQLLERLQEVARLGPALNAGPKCKMPATDPIEAVAARFKCRPPTRRKLTLSLVVVAAGVLLSNLSSSIAGASSAEAINESPLTDYDGASFYKAPVGSRIRMACNGSHWATDESVSLVLWFKGPVEGHSVPIYTVDARQHSLGSGAARHLVADHYKGRARFTAASGPAGAPPYLDLGPLEEDDQAEYRCRIDYRTKPRENFLVILFVLVPPRSVDITDSTGRSLEQIYGPLSEDSDLTLLCLSRGGRPAPAVRWKRANKLIDDSYLTLNDFVALKRAPNLLGAPSGNNGTLAPEEASPATGNWPEWRHWPEFAYFSGGLANATGGQQELEPLLHKSQRKQPAGSGYREQEAAAAGRPQFRQLLTWPADESLTTSVNVLRLANLNVRNLGGASYEEASRLECEASNLFYDLRALIKLFAPASLTRGGGSPPQQVVANLDHEQHQWDGGQLELAIDQALDRALTSSSARWAHQPDRAPVATASGGPRARHGGAQVPLTLMSSPATLGADTGPAPANPASSSHEKQAQATAAVFQQLLDRPHQLSASANFSAPPPPPSSPHQRQDQLSLVRTRLITLDIYMRPQSVSISQLPAHNQRSGGALSAGQLAEFSCSASGSRPAAKLTWFKGREPLNVRANLERQSWDSASGGDNSSDSRLTVRIQRSDHGQQLTCRAENEPLHQLLANNHLPTHQSVLEDSRTLSVQYPPQVKLELGNRALSRQVREGADIYFVCQVEANPPVRDITWLHEQQPVNTTVGKLAGGQLGAVIVSNNSLVLQRVRLDQRGRYACACSNSEGYAQSNHLELRVLHAPMCASQPEQPHELASHEIQPVLLGSRQVAIRAHTQFECRVEADPPEVEISWYLAAGHQSPRRQISSAQVGSPQTTGSATLSSSKLNYQVQSPLDYGQLHCVAKNQLGEQKRACAWNIEPPDPSRAPPSCALLNVTDSSVTAACSVLGSISSSQDPRSAHTPNNRQLNVELYRGPQADEASLEANLSTVVQPEEPYFEVNSLRPGTRYTMLIRSDYGQPPAELSFATHSSTSGFRLDPRTGPPLGEPSASLSALISTRSASLADSAADWTQADERSFGSRPAPPPPPASPTSTPGAEPRGNLQSLWSWFSGSVLRAVGLEQRPATDSIGSGSSGWLDSPSGPAIGAGSRIRPAKVAAASPNNKLWELSWWSSSGGPAVPWRQLITGASLVGACLLVVILLLAHRYSLPGRVGRCMWWAGRRSRASAISSTDHNYHLHQNATKTRELVCLGSDPMNPSSGTPSNADSVQSMKGLRPPSPHQLPSNPKAPPNRASTLDRTPKRASSSLIKSRSSFSFEPPAPEGVAPAAGSYALVNAHNDLGSRLFLTTSTRQHWHGQQQQLGEAHGTQLSQLEAPPLAAHLTAQGLHRANGYDMLTMQLCEQILHLPNQPANPVSLIKSNEPLILTGPSSQPQQQTVVEGRDDEHMNPHGCCQVSCLMHEQSFTDAAQFVTVPSDGSYLDEQQQLDQWSSTTGARGGPVLVGQCEPTNFMDQQMHFIELLPGHLDGQGGNSAGSQQKQWLHEQQQCMAINRNFVNIVTGAAQSTAPSGAGDASAHGKRQDISGRCKLTQCHHQPATCLEPHNSSLECPSLSSSASPSLSTLKDQSPLSLTATGQSTVTNSTNYSTSELFPFSAGSGINYLALPEQQQQQQHRPGRPASSSLGPRGGGGGGKLLHSISRPVAGATQYLEEADHSGLLVCAHNHQATGSQQPPIASILKPDNLVKRNR